MTVVGGGCESKEETVRRKIPGIYIAKDSTVYKKELISKSQTRLTIKQDGSTAKNSFLVNIQSDAYHKATFLPLANEKANVTYQALYDENNQILTVNGLIPVKITFNPARKTAICNGVIFDKK